MFLLYNQKVTGPVLCFFPLRYRLKPVTKCLLTSWRHYFTGRTTYKRTLAAVSQQTACWQILVRVILSFCVAFLKEGRNVIDQEKQIRIVFGFLPCQSAFVLFLWQRVKELLSCLKWRVSTDCEMMMRLLLPLMIPSSRLQRLVPFLCFIKTGRKPDTLWQSLISQAHQYLYQVLVQSYVQQMHSRLLLSYIIHIYTEVCVFLSVQLFDAMSLEEVYQPLKPAALYEEALSLVRESNVAYRSLR